MLTEKIILAIVCAVFLLVVCLALIFVTKYGFKIEVGTWYLRILSRSHDSKLTDEDINKLITEKTAEKLEQHMAAVDSYRSAMADYSDNAKLTIAHKIDDIRVIPNKSISKLEMKLLVSSIRFKLLIANSENHYISKVSTDDKLKSYLATRYQELFSIISSYCDDIQYARKAAYSVITEWWNIVRTSLINATEAKLAYSETRLNEYDDGGWRKRIEATMDEQKKAQDILEKTMNLHQILVEYLREIQSDLDNTKRVLFGMDEEVKDEDLI